MGSAPGDRSGINATPPVGGSESPWRLLSSAKRHWNMNSSIVNSTLCRPTLCGNSESHFWKYLMSRAGLCTARYAWPVLLSLRASTVSHRQPQQGPLCLLRFPYTMVGQRVRCCLRGYLSADTRLSQVAWSSTCFFSLTKTSKLSQTAWTKNGGRTTHETYLHCSALT